MQKQDLLGVVIATSLVFLGTTVHGQQAVLACQPGDRGVVNGTFDCDGPSLGLSDTGWFYNAPASNGNAGFEAVVMSVGCRQSNVLRLTHTVHNHSVLYPAKALWQEHIRLGSAPAKQLVLRFDHMVLQDIAYEDALNVVFTARDACDLFGDTSSEILAVSSFAGTAACNWVTSEIYLDMPEGVTNANGVECSIEFRMKRVMAPCTLSSPPLSPEVWLDNIEIRVIDDVDAVVDLDNWQPLACTMNPCGGLDENNQSSVEESRLVRMLGPVAQNVRIYESRCTTTVVCCGGSARRESAEVEQTSYVPPLSTSPLPCCTGRGDLNCDGQVGGADITLLLAAWGECGPEDLNGDGVVAGADLTIVLSNWGPCP